MSLAWTEEPLTFECQGDRLLGVLAEPEAPPATAAGDLGVLIVVGGPQYRGGSHRQFTLLARHLAAAGLPVLRFDVRGMGDSEGALRSFEALDEDVAAAIDAFCSARPALRRIVLWGLCDGASAALLYLHARPDPRVAALCLLNPWVRSAQTLAATHVKHYYWARLQEAAFWRKLLQGGVALKALRGLLENLRQANVKMLRSDPASGPASYTERMAAAWSGFSGPTLLLMSERDLTAQEFDTHTARDAAWQRALRAHPPQRVPLAAADHTCSTPAAHAQMLAASVRFLLPLAAKA
jgi:uncharacterized protein